MSEKDKEIIKVTSEGRVYKENSDFFDQMRIKRIILRLQDSSIYREIEQKKKEEEEEEKGSLQAG